MKYLGLLIFGVMLGAIINSVISDINPRYFLVKIIDSNDCSNPSYSIVLKEFSISVESDQIFKSSKPDGMSAEAKIYVMPPYSGKNTHAYTVIAEYSNCETIRSENRYAKRGQIIYELVDNDKITYKARK